MKDFRFCPENSAAMLCCIESSQPGGNAHSYTVYSVCIPTVREEESTEKMERTSHLNRFM